MAQRWPPPGPIAMPLTSGLLGSSSMRWSTTTRPFVGTLNEVTLRNILHKPLAFPSLGRAPTAHELQTHDLITGLLYKDSAQ
ncbi:hypothetical protein NL676_039851 [Syzygium grande]|nr:hypothetical protein NL676_039851 [Syzygium grande]